MKLAVGRLVVPTVVEVDVRDGVGVLAVALEDTGVFVGVVVPAGEPSNVG